MCFVVKCVMCSLNIVVPPNCVENKQEKKKTFCKYLFYIQNANIFSVKVAFNPEYSSQFSAEECYKSFQEKGTKRDHCFSFTAWCKVPREIGHLKCKLFVQCSCACVHSMKHACMHANTHTHTHNLQASVGTCTHIWSTYIYTYLYWCWLGFIVCLLELKQQYWLLLFFFLN